MACRLQRATQAKKADARTSGSGRRGSLRAPRTHRVLPGIVKARIESDLAFRVPGKLAERLVDAGAMVKKGDPLARLDDGDLRLQVEQADADYSSAKGALDQAAGGRAADRRR